MGRGQPSSDGGVRSQGRDGDRAPLLRPGQGGRLPCWSWDHESRHVLVCVFLQCHLFYSKSIQTAKRRLGGEFSSAQEQKGQPPAGQALCSRVQDVRFAGKTLESGERAR